ncbi:unannotated protein [freshwater metagenome]|uniref:Unannotated protein n=1 Tax=freshwater metagenome TaxID=449393 RepID=A0A6J5ZT43_9ZZZZ|nr:SIS domain-containing protein [Actinomycetota bacterium]
MTSVGGSGPSDPAAVLAERADEHTRLLSQLQTPESCTQLAAAAATLVESLSGGGTIYFCGNGGSSADAQHLVAEFVGRYRADRRPLAAVALGSTQAVASALANDYGYAEAGIARELDALAREGDVLVALSTSGCSPNVIAALEMARAKAVRTVAMTGLGHQLGDLADCLIVVDSAVVALIQEIHAVVGHVICELVEEQMGFAV